jgi:signal transduction histidine kinase/ActR/RegA family two-component response regulator
MRVSERHPIDRREARYSLRDVATLTALPARLQHADRRLLAESMAIELVRILDPEFIYLRLAGEPHATEITRYGERANLAGRQAAIWTALQAGLAVERFTAGVFSLPVAPGAEPLSGFAVPIGAAGELGVLVAASGRTDFPTEDEQLFLGVARDQLALVLERQRAEESLRRSERELTDFVESAKLVAALKESDHRKDEFLAILAHELRNPLAPVKHALQILRVKGPTAPELQWAREVIDRQIQQMARLVDDLLDVARISQGKIELRRARVALAAVLNSAVEAGRPLIEEAGHTLVVALPAEAVYLDADPARLSQVVLNLLNNAAKYTEPGGRISLSAERDGDDAVLRVADTGVGIPREMLARIFDMFAQADRSLERAQGGLGIGLTLVRRLVEMHGGTVKADSAGTGKGSEFTVRLPAAPAGAQLAGARPGPADEEDEVVTAVRRILVVDDNKDAADSLAMLLRMLGNEVHTAYDGVDAVGAASGFRPDVVLMDIGLPRLNGYDAARRIRDLREHRPQVLVALTGWGQEEDRRRSVEAGFDYHMIKPVELDELQRLLAGLRSK